MLLVFWFHQTTSTHDAIFVLDVVCDQENIFLLYSQTSESTKTLAINNFWGMEKGRFLTFPEGPLVPPTLGRSSFMFPLRPPTPKRN